MENWKYLDPSALSAGEWASLAATIGIGVLLIFLARRGIPRLFRRISAAMQENGSQAQPGSAVSHEDRDALSSGMAALCKALVWISTFLIAATVVMVVMSVAAPDARGALGRIREWGIEAGHWLLPRLIRVGVIVALTWAAVHLVRAIIPLGVRRYLAARQEGVTTDIEAQKRSQTLGAVAVTVLTWLIVTMALFVIFSELGFDIGPVLAGAGVVGLAVGFGAQNLVRDFFAGIFILLEDQYRIGDVVDVAGKSGLVHDLSLRRTVLRDMDYNIHFIPNGEIKIATNLTRGVSRVNLNIEVAYKEDLEHCIEVINRVGQGMYDEKFAEGAMKEPLKVLRVEEFGESGIVLKVLGETTPIKQWDVAGEFRRRIKKAFDAEGIEIPFPHVTLYWGKDQAPTALAGAKARPDERAHGSEREAGPPNGHGRSGHGSSASDPAKA